MAFVSGAPLTVTLGGLVTGMLGLGGSGCKPVAAEKVHSYLCLFFLWVGFVAPVQVLWLLVCAFAGVLWVMATAVLSRQVATVFSGSRPRQSFVAYWFTAFVCILWVVVAAVLRCGLSGFCGFPILHEQSGRAPFRVGMSGLPLSGRLAHKLPSVGFVSSGLFRLLGVFGQVAVWRRFWVVWLNRASTALVCFLLPKLASVGKVRVKSGKAGFGLLLWFGQSVYPQAQQVSQRDAPPRGSFEVWFFIKVWGFVSLSLAARPLP